jgi:hypothetical protein
MELFLQRAAGWRSGVVGQSIMGLDEEFALFNDCFAMRLRRQVRWSEDRHADMHCQRWALA